MKEERISERRFSCHGCVHNTAGVESIGDAINKGSVDYQDPCAKCYLWDLPRSIRMLYSPDPRNKSNIGSADADTMRDVW